LSLFIHSLIHEITVVCPHDLRLDSPAVSASASSPVGAADEDDEDTRQPPSSLWFNAEEASGILLLPVDEQPASHLPTISSASSDASSSSSSSSSSASSQATSTKSKLIGSGKFALNLAALQQQHPSGSEGASASTLRAVMASGDESDTLGSRFPKISSMRLGR
jgi:hypothetical protein